MAFDLDNEELRATRKLHKINDDLYEETSDKNVGSIEDIRDLLLFLKSHGWIPDISRTVNITNIVLAIDNVLQEREQDKKRIQELEKENAMLKLIRVEYEYGYENIHLCTKNDLVKIDKNKYLIEVKDGKFVDIKQLYIDTLSSIPKQKVKDEIEALRKMLKATTEGILQEYTVEELIIKITTLEELLEGEK